MCAYRGKSRYEKFCDKIMRMLYGVLAIAAIALAIIFVTADFSAFFEPEEICIARPMAVIICICFAGYFIHERKAVRKS